MEQRRLGASGLEVSTLCLGAMTFGEADEKSFMHKVGSDEETAMEVMDAAVAAGITFIDTADVYGQDGLSERVLGRWMKDRKNRESLVVATKFRFRMGPGPNQGGAARIHVVRACEASLKRLGTDHIDLYQIHMQDVDVPEEETLRALDDLVRAGKVLYVGCSNYAAYRLMHSLDVSDARGLTRFVGLQAQYSLLSRELDREHLPLCKEHRVGILPWSPLAGGLLSGKYRAGQSAPAGTRMESDRFKQNLARLDNPRAQKTLVALEQVAAETSHSMSAVALAWLLGRPAVTSVIFGARTVDQLKDNLSAATLKLTAAQQKALDDASAIELGYPYDFMQRVQGRW